MAIRGVNLAEKEAWVHPEDPGHHEHLDYKKAVEKGYEPEKPTTYYIGNLTASDRIELGDMGATPTMRDGGITMSLRNTQRSYEVVKRGLKGWDNQLDYSGKPAKFEEGTLRTATGGFQPCVSDASMVHLPQQIINDLASQILKKNGMTNELEKKFEGASSQSVGLNSVIGDVPDVLMPTNESAAVQTSQNEK